MRSRCVRIVLLLIVAAALLAPASALEFNSADGAIVFAQISDYTNISGTVTSEKLLSWTQNADGSWSFSAERDITGSMLVNSTVYVTPDSNAGSVSISIKLTATTDVVNATVSVNGASTLISSLLTGQSTWVNTTLNPGVSNEIAVYTESGSADVALYITETYSPTVSVALEAPAYVLALGWFDSSANVLYIAGDSTYLSSSAITVYGMPSAVWISKDATVKNRITDTDATLYITTGKSTTVYILTDMTVDPTTYANVTVANYDKYQVKFTADAPAGERVVFGLYGLTAKIDYDIYVDGNLAKTVSTDVIGSLSFDWSSWSEHTFTIEPSAEAQRALNVIIPVFIVAVLLGAFGAVIPVEVIRWTLWMIGAAIVLIMVALML